VKIAAEISAPLSQAKKITMISSGGGDIGVAKLSSEVLQLMERLPKMVEGVTGIDISKVFFSYHFVFVCNNLLYVTITPYIQSYIQRITSL
jgi:hypothetical protein